MERIGVHCKSLMIILLFNCRLNEGHTKYVERKIVGQLYGEKRRQFEANGGWAILEYTVSQCDQTSK